MKSKKPNYLEAIRAAVARKDFAEMERLRVEWFATLGTRAPRRVSPRNRGKIYVQRNRTMWRISKDDPAPTGDEFEQFSLELDSFLFGYFAGIGAGKPLAYTGGDFFEERTESVGFWNRSDITPRFVSAVQRWLAIPRRENCRVLIPGSKLNNNYIVIYCDKVVLRPGMRSLAQAISEKK